VNPVARVANPPPKPLLVFDGDCHFCTLWIQRWKEISGDAIVYAPFQSAEVAERFPEIPRGQFAAAVQLIEPDGRVSSGARATFGALANNPAWRWPLWAYERWPAFSKATEAGYRFVASHRPLFSKLTRLSWGEHVEQPTHFKVRWLFLRGLALIYLIAFVSLWTQIDGLVGSKGILPSDQFMASVNDQVKANDIGLDRFRLLPTLCWFNVTDASLHWQCACGVVLSILLLVGIAPAPCLALLWLIYLSLSTVCREFLGFQWDILLLETGFLAICFAPFQLWPRRARETPPARIILWLLRLLLFKLMFQSGVVKLMSGDMLWRQLTALTMHYETQPLPTWLGWYAHQLPLWFQKFSCAAMFAIELVVPFLIFAPRRPRMVAAALLAMLQGLILLTGNYTFFNWLTLLLCVLLLDDSALRRFSLRDRRRNVADDRTTHPIRLLTSAATRRRWGATIPLALLIVPITCWQLLGLFRIQPAILKPFAAVQQWLAPFRSLNSYGLFAVMTPSRPEIIIEGSNDGVTWLPYEFKYKPGDLKRRPAFVAPHQPRLDWQMWFAALGNRRDNPWFRNLCLRLLQGSPEVLGLLDKNPFPRQPPRYLRATVYHYQFTTFAERRKTGDWWRRATPREYLPPVSLH